MNYEDKMTLIAEVREYIATHACMRDKNYFIPKLNKLSKDILERENPELAREMAESVEWLKSNVMQSQCTSN